MKRLIIHAQRLLLLAGFLAFYTGANAQCSNMSIVAQNYKVCVDNSLVLVAKGIPAGSDYTWNFGSQTITDDLDTVRFIAINEGTFKPYLMVKTASNLSCKVELPTGKSVEVVGKPAKLQLDVSPSKDICSLPQLVTIDAKGGSSGMHYTYIIETHGSSSLDYLYRAKSERSSVTHRLYYEGYKRVILEIENADGCKTNMVFDSLIAAFDMPEPSFTVSDPKTCDKKTVDYKSSLSSGSSVYYDWQFDGGKPSTSVLPNPNNIVYEGKGSYSTTLTISNGKGCQKSVTNKTAVQVGQQEVIDISISKNNGCITDEIILQAKGNNLDNNYINWNLSGATTNYTNPQNTLKRVTYKNAGTYDVGLNYTFGGCATNVLYPDTVVINRVTAKFEASAYCDCNPGEITFTNKSSSSDPNDVLSYQWSIADNDGVQIFTSTDKNPKFKFTQNGKYKVYLTVISSHGCTDQANTQIRFSPLKASFNMSADHACMGETVTAQIDPTITCLNKIKTIEWTLYNSKGKVVTTQNTQDFKYTFSKVDQYALELYLKNEAGCEDDNILFYAVDVFQLKTTVTTNEDYLCAGDEVSLTSKNGPYAVTSTNSWLISDPVSKARFTGNGSDIKFNITEAGTFDVLLIAKRNAQCADTVLLEKQFFVSGAKAEIVTNKRASCVPFNDYAHAKIVYNIQHKNPQDSLQFLWESSNKSGINIINPSGDSTAIEITESNYYNLKLTLTNGEGCVTRFEKSKAYEAGVVARFSSNSTACIDVPLHTNNTSTVNANNYKWFVSDTSVQIKPKPRAEDPRLVFTQTGSYNIGLVAKNNIGCIDTFYKTINVIEFEFDFTSEESNSLLCAPALVKFQTSQTNVDSFVWTFGDGDTLGMFGEETGHFYDILDLDPNNEYKFDVSLVAMSKYGCSDTLTKTEFIKLAGPRPKFIADPTEGSNELEVEFFNFNEGVSYFLFDYGDESSVDSNVLSKHLYTIKDTSQLYVEYLPKMVAFDDRGCTRSLTGDPIRIYNSAMARFTADTLEACENVVVQLKNFSTFADSFAWYLNNADTAFSTERSPQVALETGTHTITLKAFNVAGYMAAEKKKNYIRVYKNPVVEMARDYPFYCTNHQVKFTDLSYGENEIAKRLWDFDFGGSGSDTSGLQNPTFSYQNEGLYSVKLSVTDKFGCQNEKIFTDTIEVGKPANISHEGLGYIGFASNNVLTAHISNLDTTGINGFLIYEEMGGQLTEMNAIGRQANSILPSGDYQLRLRNKNAQYRVMALNDCRDTLPIGKLHKPVYLQVTPGSNNFLPQLQWSAYNGWDSVQAYRIYRSINGEKATLLKEVPAQTFNYTDSMVCKNFYQYYVAAVQQANEAYISNSNRDTVSPVYKAPTGVTDLFTTTVVDNKYILTTWNPHPHPQVDRYIISRTDPNFGFVEKHAVVSDTFYLDTIDVFVNRDVYQYQITGIDYCESKAGSSSTGNNIVIGITRNEQNIDIEWNSFEDWPADQTVYYLQRATESSDFETIYSGKNTNSYTDGEIFTNEDEIFRYRIMAVYGAHVSYSNEMREIPDLHIFIPNAFSPNNDGTNDVYLVTGSGAENGSTPQFDKFRMTIINRWGEIVYDSNDINEGWDGTFKGVDCPMETYVYSIQFRDKSGKFVTYQGNLSLIK
ncbi:PKD domain-containing protein [bacterium]|nr:PKD domain-containing protein [bacterium]